MTDRRKRVVLGLSQKIEIIQRLRDGENASSIARAYRIGKSTVTDIKRDAHKIENHVLKLKINDGNVDKRKTMKLAKNDRLDTVMYQWFVQQRVQGISLSGPTILAKAIEMNTKLGGDSSFKASTGWLTKFKLRHDIKHLGMKMDYGCEILNDDELILRVTTKYESEPKQVEPIRKSNTISHVEAEIMLTRCIEWLEVQKEANAIQLLLLHEIRALAAHKTCGI